MKHLDHRIGAFTDEPGIPGITAATRADTNSYNGVKYAAGSPAPPAMPTDPGHEFSDVVEQLCGPGVVHTPWQPYNRPIVNTGYVANYATTRTEITSNNPNPTPTRSSNPTTATSSAALT